MFAGVGEGTAAGATVFEVGAVLVHLAKFLAHKANNFYSEHGLGSDKFEEGGSGDEAEAAVGLTVGAKGVRGGAECCWESDDAPGSKQPFEDFAAVICEDGNTGEPVLNDVDSPALCTLPQDDIVAESGYRFGERLEGPEEVR